jgi:hypothetical protein
MRVLIILMNLITAQLVQNFEVPMQYQFSVPTAQVHVNRSRSEHSESILQTKSSFEGAYFNIIFHVAVKFPN